MCIRDSLIPCSAKYRVISPKEVSGSAYISNISRTSVSYTHLDRRMTILLTPFMSCSAKLPIYTMMISAFFPRRYRALAMIGLYLFGILCGILYAVKMCIRDSGKRNERRRWRF